MAIIITRGGKNALKIQQTPPRQEDELQRYISDNPDSLPLDDIKDNPRLLVVGREFDTNSGPIDVLALDGDGDIYVIETKLYKNPDKRLVIAQMLDYGAALAKTYGSGDDFLHEIDRILVESKAGGIGKRLKTLYKFDGEKVTQTQEQIKRNLSDGNLKFVVLMDRLSERLRDLILFINQKSRFNIYAVEMEFYQHDGMEIVIPKLYGAEVTKEVGSGSSGAGRRKWSEQTFFDDVNRRLSPIEQQAVREMYDGSKAVADGISFGTSATAGSFSPKFAHASQRSFYTVKTDGTLTLNFGWHDRSGEEEGFPKQEAYRDAFKQALDSTGFASIPEDYKRKWIEVPAAVWMPKTKQFLHLVSRTFNERIKGAE